MKKIGLFLLPLILFFGTIKAQHSTTGKITAVKGNIVSVVLDEKGDLPTKTDTCDISKDISGTKNPFGITVTSGWMSVGEGIMTSSKDKTLTFKITKETSNIVVNGKKKPNFEAGKKVKIEWK